MAFQEMEKQNNDFSDISDYLVFGEVEFNKLNQFAALIFRIFDLLHQTFKEAVLLQSIAYQKHFNPFCFLCFRIFYLVL